MKQLLIAALLATGLPALTGCGSPMGVEYRAAPPADYLDEQKAAARKAALRPRNDGSGVGTGPGTGAGYN